MYGEVKRGTPAPVDIVLIAENCAQPDQTTARGQAPDATDLLAHAVPLTDSRQGDTPHAHIRRP
jgi:hypothetical protein